MSEKLPEKKVQSTRKQSPKAKKQKKNLTFTLKLVSTLSEIHNTYGINGAVNSTRITEEPEPNTVMFQDEFRKVHRCCVSSINFSNTRKYNCFWDRHAFSTTPFGCPIAFKPMTITRTYNSEISKEKFRVNESVSSCQDIPGDLDFTTNETHSYYETDGIFCSLNCALSFAIENRHNPLYNKSIPLIHRIYTDFFQESITPAPSWRVLVEYGGTIDIDKFRENFSHVEYDFKGLNRPCFKPIGYLFEERIKL